jgi:uncharacterized membrane protein YjdF
MPSKDDMALQRDRARPDERLPGSLLLATAVLATLALCWISFGAGVTVAKYRWSFVFLVPLLWGVLAARRVVALHPLHFALFAIALVLHDLGAFGWYSRRIAGLQFDWLVHFFFGLVGGSILARALRARLGLRGAPLAVLAVLATSGIGALHEIVEAASTMVLGEQGMHHVGPDNPFDSQEDMLGGFLGSCAAALLAATGARRHPQ